MTATLALFIAIGGTSYAALRVDSGDIVNDSIRSVDLQDNKIRGRDIRFHTIRGNDVRRNTLEGDHIREAGLASVPRAEDALRLGGATRFDLTVRCPQGTVTEVAGCFEEGARPPAPFSSAINACASAGRRLPSYAELSASVGGNRNPGGEWTSSVYRNPANGSEASDQLEVVVLTADDQGVAFRQALTPEQLPFRCVASPSN